ncbi:MAG: hypothetical protein ABL986_19050 [Vicinamibacterales bacterium]
MSNIEASFAGTVRYTLSSADQGMLRVSISDQSGAPMPIFLHSPDRRIEATVTRGTGLVTLIPSLNVPGLGLSSLTVTYTLTPSGPGAPVSTSVKYSVQGAGLVLLSMQPPAGSTLRRGQVIQFQGTVLYNLDVDSGRLSLVIQDQANRNLQRGDAPSVVVSRGRGEATLTQSLTIPTSDVSAINVFFALRPAGASVSSNVILAPFTVE